MFLEEFLNYLKWERNYADKTVYHYGQDLHAFEEYLQTQAPGSDWAHVDASLIRQWMIHLAEKGNTAASINRRLSSLRCFFKYLLTVGYLEIDPACHIKGPKKQKPLPYFVKESDMDKLLDEKIALKDSYENRRDCFIVALFYATGMRLSELSHLCIEHIDLSAGNLTVTGKRNKQRIIPFGNEIREALLRYLELRNTLPGAEGQRILFLTANGHPISDAQIRRRVKWLLSQITTQKKNSPHVLRHTFATSMLNHDANLEVVKEILGHQSLATTEIYTHTTFEELKKVYNRAHPRA